MRIAVYIPDEPRVSVISDAWAQALYAEGHDVFMDVYPQPEVQEPVDLGFEVGCRTGGCNIEVPIIHYIQDPIDIVPREWLEAQSRGHLFFFSDYEAATKAHKQGLRVAEHIPPGYDMHSPGAEADLKYDVGYFGSPSPLVIDLLVSIKARYPDWKIGLWGNAEEWRKTVFGDYVVSEIPGNVEALNKVLAQCRFMFDDPDRESPTFIYLQACASPCVAIGTYTADRAALFMNGEGQCWTITLHPKGNLIGRLAELACPDAYGFVQEKQRAIVGPRKGRFQRRSAVMECYGAGFNRMQDRWHYIDWLFETKQLYANAKGSCPPRALAELQLDAAYASIQIRYMEAPLSPTDAWYRNFDLDWTQNIRAESIATMLRTAARKIEERLERGEKLTPNVAPLERAKEAKK